MKKVYMQIINLINKKIYEKGALIALWEQNICDTPQQVALHTSNIKATPAYVGKI